MRVLIHIVYIFALIGLFSCKSTRYIPVNSVTQIKDSVVLRDSTITKEVISRKDSIVLRDSFVTVLDDKGNVIRTEVYKQKEIYNDLQSYINKLMSNIDKIISEKSDTILEPYPVEAQLTKWQKLKQDVGGFAIIAFISIFLSVLFYFIYKIKK